MPDDGVMAHAVESEGDSRSRGTLRSVRTLTEDSRRVRVTPNRARDCKGPESGLKHKVALNKVHDPCQRT